jgi:hypothetical protein
MSRNGNRSRTPLSPALRAQLVPAREAQPLDTCVLIDSRPVRDPYWTPKGLVLRESRATISYWDGKTQTRRTKTVARYRPTVITGPSVEGLRAQERAAVVRARRRGNRARRPSGSKAKSKKGKSP